MRSNLKALGLACAVLSPAAAAAQAPATARQSPVVVSEVLGCRALTDSSARLACYDRSVAALGAAQTTGELVTVDRQDLRKARRSLFGLTLPNLKILGDDNDSDEGSQIETKIVRTGPGADGKWIFELAEGGRWVQIDSREFITDPAAGQPIRIRRGAIGSFMANVNNQRAIRVRRIN
jgi:hypothetical protein